MEISNLNKNTNWRLNHHTPITSKTPGIIVVAQT